jgi:L-ribulose-5-phosphate 4-epimerase
MAAETGYIKYECIWEKAAPGDDRLVVELNACRDRLFNLGLIGAYANGIGYGNISIRLEGQLFLITGTSTGHIAHLTSEHYTTVTGYSFAENKLTCYGPIKASAESLTHAAVYESGNAINAVVHIHSYGLWEKLKHTAPTTSVDVAYGTPEMALEIKRLFRETDVLSKKIIVMAGHEEGIISFGANLEEALDIILKYAEM